MSGNIKTVRRMLGIITLDQTITTLSLPIITLIFFDQQSSLFPKETSHVIRSLWYGTCIATPYMVNLFFAPIISALSDELGRKKILLFELASAFLYTFIAGIGVFLGSLWLVVASFIIRGAFSRTNTTALSIVGDVCTTSNKLRYMSHLQLAISVGACLGPVFGGLIGGHFLFNTFNYSLVFFIAAFSALLNISLSFLFIEETLAEKNSVVMANKMQSRLKANLQAIKYVVTHPDILKISSILLLLQISWSTYYQFIAPLLKTTYVFNAHSLGMFMGMIGFWLIIGSGPFFRFLNSKFNTCNILNIGAGMVILGYLITIACYYELIQTNWALWVSAASISIGDVVTYICLTTLYSNVVPGHMQGKVMGVNFLIIGLIWGSMSFVGGVLIGYSIILPMLLAPAGAAASLLAINSSYGKNVVYQYSF